MIEIMGICDLTHICLCSQLRERWRRMSGLWISWSQSRATCRAAAGLYRWSAVQVSCSSRASYGLATCSSTCRTRANSAPFTSASVRRTRTCPSCCPERISFDTLPLECLLESFVLNSNLDTLLSSRHTHPLLSPYSSFYC